MVDTGPTNFKPLQLNGCKGFLMLKEKALTANFFHWCICSAYFEFKKMALTTAIIVAGCCFGELYES